MHIKGPKRVTWCSIRMYSYFKGRLFEDGVFIKRKQLAVIIEHISCLTCYWDINFSHIRLPLWGSKTPNRKGKWSWSGFCASGQGGLAWTFYWCCRSCLFSCDVLQIRAWSKIETMNTEILIYKIIDCRDYIYELKVMFSSRVHAWEPIISFHPWTHWPIVTLTLIVTHFPPNPN